MADETSYRWRGRMAFVDNALDVTTGTIKAHAIVPNPNHFLTPGMFGRARLRGSGTYKALLVPDEVIVADQSRKLVFVLGRDGKVAQTCGGDGAGGAGAACDPRWPGTDRACCSRWRWIASARCLRRCQAWL